MLTSIGHRCTLLLSVEKLIVNEYFVFIYTIYISNGVCDYVCIMYYNLQYGDIETNNNCKYAVDIIEYNIMFVLFFYSLLHTL